LAGQKIKAYYVASTHWDREWYEAFQSFRYHLVRLLDEVLDTMHADPRYAVFQTDGQSIIVEDYLEIRPEREALVREYAAAGRLRIGPWYTMPDENLVLGESMIRNLEEGLRVAAEYGHASRVGFVCDMFGHVSQMPQILQGFGIDNAFVFRGVNEDTHGGLFRWRASDGSEVVAFRFGPHESYFDYAAHVRQAYDHAVPYNLEEYVARLGPYIEMQRDRTGLDTVLLFDGGDHMPIEPRTPDVLAALREKRPDFELAHVGLAEYAAALQEQKDRIDRVSTGELRDPGRLPDGNWVIPGVLSSRVYLKLANRARETELLNWAEPFSHVAARLAGHEYPHAFVRRSWRFLLENHAHDSICGCSPDQIHRDMEFRFDQSRLINEKVIRHALEAVATRVDLPDQDGENFALSVFNPTQRDIDGPVDLELWFDEKTTSLYAEFFKFEWKVGFRLFDADDRELPYDFVSYRPQRRRFHRPWGKVCIGQECIVVKVTVPLKIPAFGYTTLTCRPVAEHTRHPASGILRGDRTLENEHLRVTVLHSGALQLFDKRSGQTYDRLLIFEERADIGDGWYHGIAVNDQIFSTTNCHAEVAVIADGAARATLRITNRLQVPRSFLWGTEMRRSDDRVDFAISTDVTLRAGATDVEFRTEVDNTVRDHRLRVLFESHTQADTYLADSAFDVIERPVGLPPDSHTYKELAVETTPQAHWTAVTDEQRGLAVVAPGLPETTVRNAPERPLALTLFRGFRRTVFQDDNEPGGQCLGRHVFEYRLVPLDGRPDPVALTLLAQRASAGVRSVEVSHRNQPPATERRLPRTHGELRLDPGRVVVSSFRRHPTSGRLELRLYNLSERPAAEKLIFAHPVAAAARTDFDGGEEESLDVAGDTVTLSVPPRKIVTVAVDLQS
jgi:alpha-mannosidase